MLNNCKILWKEGMFLEPHHFQQSARLASDHVSGRVATLSYAGFQYGFTELDISRDALLSENFSIVSASGVFSDGSCFEIGSGAHSKALSRSFSGYCRADQQTLDVYLVIPSDGPGAMLTDTDKGVVVSGLRYIETRSLVHDELMAHNDKEIDVGTPNYQIRFEDEPLDGCVSLLVARLVRNGAGFMELTKGYSPPVLFFRCSDALKERVGGLLELLWAKIASLARCRGQSELGRSFFSASEVGSAMMLNALCTFTPLLSRLCDLPRIHPFEIYTHLTTLYGSLIGFMPEISLDMVPAYNHDDPGAMFTEIEDRIRDALAAEFWTTTAQLELERLSPVMWSCRFPDERFVRSVNLFIGVASENKSLMVDILRRMKVCSRDKLDLLISSSSPGLSLIRVQKAPEGLAAKRDYIYFAVDKQSALWKEVEMSLTLGIYFPGEDYGDIKLELLALRHE